MVTSRRKDYPLSNKSNWNINEPKEVWNIDDIELFYTTIILPTQPIELDCCSTIIDMTKFVDSHLSIVKAQNGNPRYKPYLDRLLQLKSILTINSN